MTEVDGPDIETAINEAVEQVVREHEGGFTIRWVAIIETAGPDGDRGVWTLTSPEVETWDMLGLLEYGKQRTIAEWAAEHARDDEDE